MIFFASTPEKWIRTHVGNYCDVQIGKMLQNDPSSERDELKPYLRAINIGKEGLDLSHEFSMWIRPQEVERFRLRIGDVLVSEGGDAGRATTFNADGEYYFQNAINRVRPNHLRKIESEFIYYWFTFLKVSGYVEMICNVATIPHFTAEKVKAAPLALPPLDTQRRIAQFLDEKTARINALVGKKRELLERLAEKRQALITRAVTKGLDPDAPMRDTGIPWLGEAPEHWITRRADFATTSNKLQVDTSDMEDKKVLHFSIPNVQDYGGGRVEEGVEIDSAKLKIVKMQLLVSRLNPRKSTICIAVPHEEYLTVSSVEFVPIAPDDDTNLRYCYYVWLSDKVTKLLSGRVQSVTRSHQRVSPEDIRKIFWSWPPATEQQQIAGYLDRKTAQIDALKTKIQKAIATLTEYRTALITAATTGKIDVQEALQRQ